MSMKVLQVNVPPFIDFVAALQSVFVTSTRGALPPKLHEFRFKQNKVGFLALKWYCDENHIFPIEPTLKHKQVACMTRKMMFTIFKYLFSFQRYLSF